jgi:cell division protein ZapA
MTQKSRAIDIKILGREFRVACSEEEEPALRRAVRFVDERMQAIHDQGKVIGLERIAIMAALNIAHEFLNANSAGSFDDVDLRGRISRLQDDVDRALSGQEELF